MTGSLAKAWAVGIALLVTANVLWTFILQLRTNDNLLTWALWLFPALAAFAASYLAPRRKFLIGMSMAVLGSTLSMLANSLYEWAGLPVDFLGFRGARVLFEILLAVNLPLCLLGSVGGYFLTRGRAIA